MNTMENKYKHIIRYSIGRNNIDKPMDISTNKYLSIVFRECSWDYYSMHRNILPAYIDTIYTRWYKNGRVYKPGADGQQMEPLL